jgi:hypothetical protein
VLVGADGTSTGSEGSSGGADGSGDDATGGPLLDVGGASETGETGGIAELSCDNLDVADSTSVGCEFWSELDVDSVA